MIYRPFNTLLELNSVLDNVLKNGKFRLRNKVSNTNIVAPFLGYSEKDGVLQKLFLGFANKTPQELFLSYEIITDDKRIPFGYEDYDKD